DLTDLLAEAPSDASPLSPDLRVDPRHVEPALFHGPFRTLVRRLQFPSAVRIGDAAPCNQF
ncbi:MAG: hypothetical protein SNJ73_04825, partial [Acetobacteraceae bacterium]